MASFFIFTDPSLPQIIYAKVTNTGQKSALTVSWRTNNIGIINIAIIAENIDYNVRITTLVQAHEREATVPVNPSIPYNITVVVKNKCKHSLTSEVYFVKGFDIELHPSPTSTGMTLSPFLFTIINFTSWFCSIVISDCSEEMCNNEPIMDLIVGCSLVGIYALLHC